MECRNCKFMSEPHTFGDRYPSVRCTLGLWDKNTKQWYAFGETMLNRGPVKRLGAECIRGEYKSFDRWYEAFQKELAKQSGTGVIPKGMDKESYRESFDDGMSPGDRAAQELDDLSR